MSNLILPKEYQNELLDKNLDALFRRYPHEKARLEEVLRKPVAQFNYGDAPELPPTPSQPPIRILLLLGIGHPKTLADILNDQTVMVENYKLFIFEQDAELLAHCFQNCDLTQIINYPKTEWFLLNSFDSVKPALFRAMKPEAVTSMMLSVQMLQIAEARTEEIGNFYSKLPQVYNETAHHVLHNHGNLADSLLGIEVTLRNKEHVLNSPGVEDLKDYYKGCSALIVGAGPSLDANLEAIKRNNDKFVIIAADAALKPLMNAGIRVDYVTSIERLNAYQKPFFEDLEKVDADLIAFPVVHPEVLAIYPGRVRICYRNYSFYAYFEKAWPKGILRCGGSTSHLAVRLADYFGCRRAFFVGLDSCYEEKDGKFRSHCAGTGHPDWAEFMELKDFAIKRRHSPPMVAVNNLGEQTVTNIQYYQWIKEYSEELAYLGHRMIMKNCSAKGIAIDGIPYVDMDEAAKGLDPLVIEKPQTPAVKFTRSWDHKDLRKNLQAWVKAAEDGLKESDELLAQDTIDQDRYNALFYLYTFRFIIDDVFIAFIVQCCARDFFELDNRWWALSTEPNNDQKAKVEILKARFELFKKVLEQLAAMFGGEDGV